MRKFRRVICALLCLCMVASIIPMLPLGLLSRAADVVKRYELDTDGIDVGATYLIVNTATAGSANALKFIYGNNNNSRDLRNQTLTVQTDEEGKRYIATGFTSEADCLFQFSGKSSGKITHGNYAIDLTTSRYTTSENPQTLTFTDAGSGAYRIHYSTSSWWSTTYYLRYNNSDWARSSTSATVYLYKLVEYEVGYDIRFDGNGFTSGTLPQDALKLSSGTLYTIPEAPEDLRKDIGQDTWLFLCWNTNADGSGIEYMPGDVITVTQDLTLYADWYQQTKYTLTMITDLDGERTDVDKISGQNKTFYAVLNGGDGTYIPLEKVSEGTYSAKVLVNGDYIIYSRVDGGEYEPVHGHKVTIYNLDGSTECQHFTVNYNTAGGTWADGENPGTSIYHALEDVILTDKTPTLAGNRFVAWQDQDGKTYAPGAHIHSIDKKITLTALWGTTIDVTINITIDHNSGGGFNSANDRHTADIQLLLSKNGVNLPLDMYLLDQTHESYTYSEATRTTTYTLTIHDLPQGIYNAVCEKRMYSGTVTHSGTADTNQVITIYQQYVPDSFDIDFDVVVNWENDAQKALMPQAVNVKILYWGYDADNVLGWHTISQQAGGKAPYSVIIDPATGTGSGYCTVWKYWSTDEYGDNCPYAYRVEVTSFVMPDGRVIPASGNLDTYTPNGTGLYTATVSITDGIVPNIPEGSNTTLSGAYCNGTEQGGNVTVSVDITPFTVTLNAGEGTVDGQKQIVMQNQYLHPDVHMHTVVPSAQDKVFLGWFDENGNRADDLAGTYLTGNVTYTARYGDNIILSGNVEISTTYEQDGHAVDINKIDLPKEVMILVRKQVGQLFVTVDSQLVKISYEEDAPYGIGSYKFENLPNDGTHYQIHILSVNYDSMYDNDLDGNFSAEEEVVIVDALTATARANARLTFSPEQYKLGLQIDASQIAEGFRPTDALAQILYRDLGDVHTYQVISQHTVPPYGIAINLDQKGQGIGADDVWIRHVDGTYYEYQMALSKLYGSVEGAYVLEGTNFTADSPFTVVYGAPSNYNKLSANGEETLTATLVPKKYPVLLDLNLQGDTNAVVRGLDNYMVDDGTGNIRYAYVHTWSFGSSFEAYPYREGYVFKGWVENADSNTGNNLIIDTDNPGKIYVGATLAKPVTLTAQWEKLEGTDYTIRYLELNTNKVLHGAQAVSGAAEGSQVIAADAVIAIDGYEYAGAMVDGAYYHKSSNPAMTITTDAAENLLIIYYLPDSSSGYTEQVESNVSANKYAVLEDNGTYTVVLDTYTKDNPITTQIRYDTPLDVVLVLDQSGSMYSNGALDDLKESVDNFVTLLANHGRENEVDHRVAIVGYASDEDGGYSRYDSSYPHGAKWYNTGVFDMHGDFHAYSVTGFNYTAYTGLVSSTDTYYTYAHGEYLLLTYHEEYRHLITEEEARQALLEGTIVYGYVDGQFVELTRNSSGLWLYGEKKLYSEKEFFTYHTDVWTHREGLERREIHAYGVGEAFREVGEHSGLYTRTETKDADPMKSIYADALVPVSVGANGSGSVTPGLRNATSKLGGNGLTYVSYGMEMANSIFAANPLAKNEERIRIVIVFTDGKPGDGSNFNEEEANAALAQSYIASHTYNADVYTVGLYGSDIVDAESDQVYFMNGLSSNYPDAQSLSDVWVGTSYQQASSNVRLNLGGPYFIEDSGNYYQLTLSSKYSNRVYYNCWGYTNASGTRVIISEKPVAEGHPIITNGMVEGYTIYRKYGNDYQQTSQTGYYSEAKNTQELKQYFTNVVQDITTNINRKIILENDTILRDIMNEGLVLTDGTVITVSLQEGNYDATKKDIIWATDAQGNPILEEKISLELSSGKTSAVELSSELDENGNPKPGVAIYTYNLGASNATNASGNNYHPHTVDITGYNFSEWYISPEHTKGYKMVVTITQIEATDDVQWSRSTATNNNQSGLWLPADEKGNRQLLIAFNQPTTIFVERSFVIDYGKEFVLEGWYFDDEDDKDATPIHLDLNTADGMNYFDPKNPYTINAVNGAYGNTKYGNVRIENGKVIYTPTAMNWDGYDEFYVFGNTWRQTVLAQSANTNGNLWNKVVIIPANNVYYEDTFVTEENPTQNGIDGFTFTGSWSTVGQESGNTEIPERLESAPYGDVHGWTDSLVDDLTFTDGSAHFTNAMGSSSQFVFTGTGVEVYTRTNATSGTVVAVLSTVTYTDGKPVYTQYRSEAMDNLAVSGDYYHIPTIAFKDLPYGTYQLRLIATASNSEATGAMRYDYYIDGVRIHNPLGNTTNYLPRDVVDAYGLETNAVYTEIRDILLDYGDFNMNLPDGLDSKMGAVFIDWSDEGVGVPTYEIGVFETYGPKNEVYLSAGQAIVLKVTEGNNYYVGMKSLTGEEVLVNVSGIDDIEDPTEIVINHTTDLYYRVNPMNGYIVIQNGNTEGGALLSLTNIRATNAIAPAPDGGIVWVTPHAALAVMSEFSDRMLEPEIEPDILPESAETILQQNTQSNITFANTMFASVSTWLEEN